MAKGGNEETEQMTPAHTEIRRRRICSQGRQRRGLCRGKDSYSWEPIAPSLYCSLRFRDERLALRLYVRDCQTIFFFKWRSPFPHNTLVTNYNGGRGHRSEKEV